MNSDGGGEKEKKRREAADRKKDQRSKSATLWSAGPTVKTSACEGAGRVGGQQHFLAENVQFS